MGKPPRYKSRSAPKSRRPANVDEAVEPTATAGARTFILELFRRDRGQAADWPLIAEVQLLEAFDAIERMPHWQSVDWLLRRADGSVYARLTATVSGYETAAGTATTPF
jgi:hypothetical protein